MFTKCCFRKRKITDIEINCVRRRFAPIRINDIKIRGPEELAAYEIRVFPRRKVGSHVTKHMDWMEVNER